MPFPMRAESLRPGSCGNGTDGAPVSVRLLSRHALGACVLPLMTLRAGANAAFARLFCIGGSHISKRVLKPVWVGPTVLPGFRSTAASCSTHCVPGSASARTQRMKLPPPPVHSVELMQIGRAHV